VTAACSDDTLQATIVRHPIPVHTHAPWLRITASGIISSAIEAIWISLQGCRSLVRCILVWCEHIAASRFPIEKRESRDFTFPL
jgi:hypothetical protein